MDRMYARATFVVDAINYPRDAAIIPSAQVTLSIIFPSVLSVPVRPQHLQRLAP